jgi:hypothetical protein
MPSQKTHSSYYHQTYMNGSTKQVNQYQMGMGNFSDSELKSVINTYMRLYDPTNSENLFKWPVFNPRNLNPPKIDFSGQINNIQELEYFWTVSEHKLNPEPCKLTTCLLVGLQKLEERSKQNKQICLDIISQLDHNISSKSQEVCYNVQKIIKCKLVSIKANNTLILNKIIKMEQKLFFIYKKFKKEVVQLGEKGKMTQLLQDLQTQMTLLEQQLQNIKFMVDNTQVIIRNAW